jgi:hypothetical protein
VNVKGNKVSDRSSIDSRFFLVAQEGTNFIIQDRDGIYKTDDQITVARITADTGGTATTRERSLTFNDDEIAPILQSLDDGSAVYLTGKLEIDEPEDITATGPPDEYPTFTRAGTSIDLSYCPLEVAIELLRGQFAVGTLTARTITPAPKL